MSKILLVFVGLFLSLAVSGDINQNSTNHNTADNIQQSEHGEEVLDFWDFEIQDHELIKQIDNNKKNFLNKLSAPAEQKQLAGLRKKSKVFGSAAERNKVFEVEQLIKEVNSLVHQIENPNAPELKKEAVKVRGIMLQSETVEEEDEEENEEEEEEDTTTPLDQTAADRVKASIRFTTSRTQFLSNDGEARFITFIQELTGLARNRIRILSIIGDPVLIIFEIVSPATSAYALQQTTAARNAINAAASSNTM